jgi:cyanate permease
MNDNHSQSRPAPGFIRRWLRKVLTLAVVTVAFGWFYAWASPWAFPKSHTADFKYGVLHGALMPIALPALVMGKDVPIYAPDNSGRSYKMGYICGINACGLLFFGAAFRRPKITSANSDKSR